jgi:hypothetical protein
MKKLRNHIFILLAGLVAFSSVFAQEGHPLKGSWIGAWEGNELHGEFVLLVLNWDGNNITGTINPGTDNIVIEEANMDSSDWSVTISAGDYEIEGTIENLALPSRSVIGTWSRQGESGKFEIARQ